MKGRNNVSGIMRYSTKSLMRIISVSGVAILLLIFYIVYVSLNEPVSKAPIEIAVNNRVRKKAEIGVNLFKNVGEAFEDMYSVNSVVKSIVRKRSKKIKWMKHEIEVWGKASIAEYLWYHVLGGNTTTYSNGLLKHGEITLQNLHLRFRSGPGIIPNTVPNTVKYLILVLNGMDDLKRKFAKSWLDYLVHFKHLSKVALIILGDEKCNNDWILPYVKSRGGILNLVFITYDSPLVDNKEFFQWPLGVATYRGFPHFRSDRINVDVARQHLCSFLGTVHKNSSREVLHKVLKKSNMCFSLTRDTWPPNETYESMGRYLKTLTDSDLTLNPVGFNTECYRIYEALSLGSVPVVENVLTPGQCDSKSGNSPLRLLKEFNAPLILIEDWNDLNDLLETESKLDLQVKVERRKRIVTWYENFKVKMKNRLLTIVRKTFFNEE